MNGRVRPGALCLVLPLPWPDAEHWNGATVMVREAVPDEEIARANVHVPGTWWEVEVKDGKPRPTTWVFEGLQLSVASMQVCLPEKYLMPLDPDADVKAEASLYSNPVPLKHGTGKVPDHVTTARSI